MASLKDLRNRIASTKATQKITKAMQMVAASKLRRAQAAAVAARPYAERMDKVLGNIAAAVTDPGSSPPLLAGTGKDQVHLFVVCTAERGLCGPFNSAIVRLARDRANAMIAEGKEVKILCVGRKGYEQLRRLFRKQIVEHIDLRSARTIGFEHAQMIAEKVIALYGQGAVRCLHPVLLALQVGDRPDPDRAADHPAELRRGGGERLAGRLRVRAGRARHPHRAAAAQHRGADLPRAARERRLVHGAQMTAMDNATRNAGDMIGKQTLNYNRTRQAMITKELIEIISGAEAL